MNKIKKQPPSTTALSAFTKPSLKRSLKLHKYINFNPQFTWQSIIHGNMSELYD